MALSVCMKRRFLEDCLAKGMSLEAIGREVGKHHSTVGYWLKKHGLDACGAKKYSHRGALDRDELKKLAGSGATVDEIAKALDRNSSTVRYWLRRYEIETVNPRGRRLRESGGSRIAVFECSRHGVTEFVLEGRGYYRCKRCRAAAVAAAPRRASARCSVPTAMPRWREGSLLSRWTQMASTQRWLSQQLHSAI